MYILSIRMLHLLSSFCWNAFPSLSQSVDWSALKACQDGHEGVVVLEMIALVGNLYSVGEGGGRARGRGG